MTEPSEGHSASTPRGQQARQLAIVEMVLRRGSVGMEEIGTRMDVSVMTVYRDIDALEKAGMLQRDRGRVTAVANGLHEASAAFRMEQDTDAKVEIARRVAPRIEPGSSLMLDDSTSGIFVLRSLPPAIPLTIITNSLLVARETTDMPNVKLLMTGGEYQGWADALLGPTTLRNLSGLNADHCVLSASGIDGASCFHPYEDVGAVKRAMMQASRFSILLLHHAKLRRHALHSFARIDEFDLVVTDSRAGADEVARLREWGAPVEIAPRNVPLS